MSNICLLFISEVLTTGDKLPRILFNVEKLQTFGMILAVFKYADERGRILRTTEKEKW